MQKKILKKPNEIKNLRGKIENEDLKETLIYLETNKIYKTPQNNQLKDSKEIEEFLSQEILDLLNAKYKELGEKISELRKKGKDATVWNFQLMMIPLKLKVFSATLNKKDLVVILKRLNDIEKSLPKPKIVKKVLVKKKVPAKKIVKKLK